MHFGLTAGQVFGSSSDKVAAAAGGQNSGTAEVPFYGVYAALTGNNFFADLMYRRDIFNLKVTNTTSGVSVMNNTPVSAHGSTVASSFGYRLERNNWFAEPSIGLNVSQVRAPNLTINSGAPGTIAFNSIDSTMGKAGIRVGMTYAVPGWMLAPFASANIWKEFSGQSLASFTSGSSSAAISTTRVGTFGQFGLGLNVASTTNGFNAYIKGDIRTGNNIQGWSAMAGARYQF